MSIGSFNVFSPTDSMQFEMNVMRNAFNHNLTDLDSLYNWNTIAVDASGYDHAHAKEQLGPCRASRAMAIVHIAMFEAVNAVNRKYRSYLNIPQVDYPVIIALAVSQAAHDTLVALFPSQKDRFDDFLGQYSNLSPGTTLRAQSIELGGRCANASLLVRTGDGSDYKEQKVGIDYIPSGVAGTWEQDPVSQIPIALGSLWNQVTPFCMTSASQFRSPPFPDLASGAFAAEYNEVKSLGQEVSNTRTEDQKIIGIFWAYDGMPSLCAPPRLYNQIATTISRDKKLDINNLARYLVLINVAMADAGISSWDTKYYYKIARPITMIRRGDELGNGSISGDPSWTPLGAPSSNANGPNFSPPFPAYTSGHATFGASLFQTIRRFFGTDNIPFSFVSDEFNGVTKDNQGNVRPLIVKKFQNLLQPELENAKSRIYLGIHYQADADMGIVAGRQVANHVFNNYFKPL